MLTEVIDNPAGPPDEQGPPTRPLSDEPDEPPAAAPSGQPLDVADSLTQALAPMLEARISEAIARVLHEQLLGLNARVQREVAVVVRQAVAEALERVELTDRAQRQIGALSGGQRKRAFLARCIAQDARILLLDEPFAGVDKRSEATVVRLLRELAADGRTVLVSTHDLQALPQLAQDAVLLAGRVVFHGPVRQALQADRLASAFGLDVLNTGDAT